MAGGTWTAQNKVRPGVYIRFATGGISGLTVGDRGTVAICEPMSWGAVAAVTEITPDMNLIPLTGFDITAPENKFLFEIFKGTNRTAAPRRVLLYRPAADSAAAAALTFAGDEGTTLRFTAKYPGTVGNDLSITIMTTGETDPDENPYKRVITRYKGQIVNEQIAALTDELENTDWWDVAPVGGTGGVMPTIDATFPLGGGENGTVSAAQYSAFLTAIEPYKFDVLIYDGADAVTKSAMTAFVNRLADENGQYVQLVAANMSNPDTRFAVNVKSGVVLDDGTTLTPEQVTWWAGGAQAGARFNQSLTYAAYPGAVAVTTPLTNSEVVAALQRGEFILFADGGVVKVEQDINSLVTYTTDVGKVYRKNRVIRLCNTIANDIYAQFSQNYIGVVNNNAAGRSQFRAAIIGYLLEVQAAQGIQNFDAEDVQVEPDNDPDAILVYIAIQAVDAVEKIYMTIEVS